MSEIKLEIKSLIPFPKHMSRTNFDTLKYQLSAWSSYIRHKTYRKARVF